MPFLRPRPEGAGQPAAVLRQLFTRRVSAVDAVSSWRRAEAPLVCSCFGDHGRGTDIGTTCATEVAAFAIASAQPARAVWRLVSTPSRESSYWRARAGRRLPFAGLPTASIQPALQASPRGAPRSISKAVGPEVAAAGVLFPWPDTDKQGMRVCRRLRRCRTTLCLGSGGI